MPPIAPGPTGVGMVIGGGAGALMPLLAPNISLERSFADLAKPGAPIVFLNASIIELERPTPDGFILPARLASPPWAPVVSDASCGGPGAPPCGAPNPGAICGGPGGMFMAFGAGLGGRIPKGLPSRPEGVGATPLVLAIGNMVDG